MNKHSQTNKAAWEEAFDMRARGFGENHALMLLSEPFAFLNPSVVEALKQLPLKGGCIGQFCCNNGRELMSVVRNFQAREGVGFDIAGNILVQARQIAKDASVPCTFVQGDVCDVPEMFQSRFDLLLVTVGSLCWMDRLDAFFGRVTACLKPGGRMLIHEGHPFTGMLAVPQETVYDPAEPAKLCYSYFRQEPFVDCYGMTYLTGKPYSSKPFISYSHTMGDIITAIAQSGLRIERMTEFAQDISDDTVALEDKGIPLSYLLLAQKG